MTRREAVRYAVLTAFGLALGKYDALAQKGGFLTVDLHQWQGVLFKFGGKTAIVPVAEIFAAINDKGAK